MTAGALVLAVTAIFATKANKKFSAFTTALMAIGAGYHVHAISSYDQIMTTTGGIPLNVKIYTYITGGILVSGELKTKAGSIVAHYH